MNDNHIELKKLAITKIFIVLVIAFLWAYTCGCLPDEIIDAPIKKGRTTVQTTGTVLSRSEVHDILKTAFPTIENSRFIVHKAFYYVPTENEIRWILTASKINEVAGVNPYPNCVDRTEVFSGFCHQQFEQISVGELYVNSTPADGHAYNIALTSDSGVMIIEPQNAQIWKLRDKEIKPANFLRM